MKLFKWISTHKISGLQIGSFGFIMAMGAGSLAFLSDYIDNNAKTTVAHIGAHIIYWFASGIGVFGFLTGAVGIIYHWVSMAQSFMNAMTSTNKPIPPHDGEN